MDRDSRILLSRIAAAVIGTLLVGLAAALIMSVVDALTCGPTCSSIQGDASGHTKCLAYSSTCGHFAVGLLFDAVWTSVFAVALGTLPGIAALTLTPARKHPWRSLFVLVPGTLFGFVACLVWQTLLGTHSAGGIITLFLFPSVTGLIVALNIERLPAPLRPWPNGRNASG